VKVEDVKVGTSTQTAQITTYTQIDTSDTGNKEHITFPQVQQAILDQHGPYLTVVSASQVGGAVASQTTQNAILAVIVASIFILLYIWFSFRKVPKSLRYAFSAIIALLHDVLVVLGVFSILGKYAGIQIDALFITALLTVVGFSVHDTIVVFDRIRENMQRRTTENFDEIVNASLIQTMARSLNTSLTVLFTLLTLTLFTINSPSVHTFTLALLIGIFSGTYSSIFNASMLLVIWEKGELGFKHLGGGSQEHTLTRREIRKRELASTR
jgi:preprotein translocase SecF subunit